MQVIILKYVQVLCITVFFSNNINCDKLLLHNEQEDQQLYRIGSCAAACLAGENTTKSLESCYKLCSEGALEQRLLLVQNTELTFQIKLICRDSTSLVIKILPIPVSEKATTRMSQHDLRKSNGIPSQMNRIPLHQTKVTEREHNRIDQNSDGLPRTRRSIAGSVVSTSTSNNDAHGGVNSVISPNHDVSHGYDNDGKRRKSSAAHVHRIYLIKVQESGKELGERIVYMTNSSLVKIENLAPNKQYNITATVLSSNREFIYADKRQQFKTLPLDYTPGKINSIDVVNYQTNRQNIALLDAVITWKPAADMTCHYEILCYASHSPDFQLKPIDVQQPEELYRYITHSLELNSEYVIAVRAKNTQNPERESELQWHIFHTPSCTDWHNSSQICAPENVANLRVSSALLSGDNYQFNISWDKPRFLPDYYVVKLFDLVSTDDETVNSASHNVTGDKTNIVIESFAMLGLQYEVLITAHANNRSSTQSIMKPLHIKHISTDHWNGGRLAVIILTPILTIGLMKIFISLICRRRAKIKRYEQRCEYFKELEQKAPVDPSSDFEIKMKRIQGILQPITLNTDHITPINDEMEISLDQIKLQDVLGEGAFGLVRKGILLRPFCACTEVAVKMLKERPSIEDIKEFRREIEMMKSVGAHPNVVCIVGHYTKNVNEMMLLTEYCSKGNLLNYLRCEWLKILRKRDCDSLNAKLNKTDSLSTSGETDSKDPPNNLGECRTPGLDSGKKPENVFNFDTSFVNDKKPLAYKNISDHSSTQQLAVSPTTKIIENILYPLLDNEKDENMGPNGDKQLNKLKDPVNVCTNACKCKVEVLEVTKLESNGCNIKITTCECNLGDDSNNHEQQAQPNLVENQCYYSEHYKEKQSQGEDFTVTSTQLVEFARQIAVGMDFLARNKVVHRDLAARNVLVCGNKIAKISDFGLSRDIYQDNLYRKTGSGKLPIKWLALESLTHQVYTSQSDVWSFGVLLYEICTLGGNPYPLLSTSDLITELKSGYRMEKPSSCSKELYELMLSCWSALPNDRPNFSSIQSRLEDLVKMDEEDERPVIDLDVILEIQSTKTTSSEHSYLKPVEY